MNVVRSSMKARLAIITLLFLVCSCGRPGNEIEYRGERIKLTKSYSDFDDYKNDPENIDPSETDRVQRLVMEAPIKREFDSLLDASKAVSQIAVPGYGSGGLEQQQNDDGTVLMAFSVEIPRAQKERFFVFRGVKGRYQLIDDLVAPENSSIGSVVLEGRTLL